MPYPQLPWTRRDLERLISLSSVLADLTWSRDTFRQIPEYLAETLELEPALLALVEQRTGHAGVALLAHSSGDADEAFQQRQRQRVLEIYTQNPPLLAGSTPELRAEAQRPVSCGQNELLLCRTIDQTHRLVLVVTCNETPSELLLETLDLLGTQLAVLLRAMVGWTDDPALLGPPFDRLTEREWMIVQAMQSEDGEKQLANRLDLSPHTLHSHIKAIYRKLGAQGRLPVLLRLAAAQRRVRRLAERATPCPGSTEQGSNSAIAAS